MWIYEDKLYLVLQACGLNAIFDCTSSIESSWTDARGRSTWHSKNQTTYREFVTMQFLQHGISTDASMPCHHTGCCTGDASIYTWRPKALYLLHMSICGSWQISASTTFGQNSQLPMFDWIPARDSLPDQMTCAHCGSVHSCLESLRKHIIYGHCHQFDANRAWTRNGDEDIVEQLRLGRVDLLLADREVRKRLTPHCQFCAQTFSQACNLISHLFHQHGDIAQEAETFQHVLQQRYAPRGCYCMPPVRLVKTTHQCVAFLQLSMMHYNGNNLLSIPLAYDTSAHDRMDTHLPLPCLNLVHDYLQTRDFALLQQDPTFRRALCDRCLCCGKKVTLTGPSQEHLLRHHLQTCHAKPRHIIDCLVQMVIYRKQNDHLQTCDWCGHNIVPVDARTEYDDHLAECPALLHFAIWPSLPLHPVSHGDSTGRHSNADAGSSWQHGLGLWGVKRARHEEAEGSTTTTSIKDFFARQRLQRGQLVQDGDAYGQSLAPPRSGPDGSTVLFLSTNKEGMIAPLLQESTAWKTAQQQNLVDKPLRQHLCLFLLKTRIQRVTKLKESKSEEPVWISSIKSQLVMQMAVSSLEPCSIPMAELLTQLEMIHHQLEQPSQVVRFHSLQSKTKDVPVIPWKLEIDVKNTKLHQMLDGLMGNSVWQLISLRIKLKADWQTSSWNPWSRSEQNATMLQFDGLDTGQRWCSVLCQHSFHYCIRDSFALQWFCHQNVGASHCWDDATSFGPSSGATLHSAASFSCSWFSTVGSFAVPWSAWLWWLFELLFGVA